MRNTLVLYFLMMTLSNQSFSAVSREFRLETTKAIGVTQRGKELHLGGFSGLYFLGMDEKSKEYKFISHTDRGPNGELLKIIGTKIWARPMLLPEFSPEWIILKTNSQNKTLEIVERIKLHDSKGNLLRGVSPIAPQITESDEWLVNLSGNEVKPNIDGIDPEGITRDDEGNFWVCEEYLPSIMKFTKDGELIKRFAPTGVMSKANSEIIEILPREFRFKRKNLGFEGITFYKGKIYVALQSPLIANDNFFTIVELDPKTEKYTRQLFYPLTNSKVNKIGDLASDEDGIYVIEEDSSVGAEATRKVYIVKDLSNPNLKKELVIDLSGTVFQVMPKLEGMAVMPNKMFSFINDNDFEDRPTILGIINF